MHVRSYLPYFACTVDGTPDTVIATIDRTSRSAANPSRDKFGIFQRGSRCDVQIVQGGLRLRHSWPMPELHGRWTTPPTLLTCGLACGSSCAAYSSTAGKGRHVRPPPSSSGGVGEGGTDEKVEDRLRVEAARHMQFCPLVAAAAVAMAAVASAVASGIVSSHARRCVASDASKGRTASRRLISDREDDIG